MIGINFASVVGAGLLLWGARSLGPKGRWRGPVTWNWRGALMLRCFAILAGGTALAYGIYPRLFLDMVNQSQSESGYASLWALVVFLVAWPAGLFLLQWEWIRASKRIDQEKAEALRRVAKFYALGEQK